MTKLVPPKPRNTNPLEKVIEEKVCNHAKELGCLAYKFTSPSRRSVPDRLFILPQGKGCFFIEFKRRGEVPTEKQALEIAKIQEKGMAVFIVDDTATGKLLIRDMMEAPKGYKPKTVCGVPVTMDDPAFN